MAPEETGGASTRVREPSAATLDDGVARKAMGDRADVGSFAGRVLELQRRAGNAATVAFLRRARRSVQRSEAGSVRDKYERLLPDAVVRLKSIDFGRGEQNPTEDFDHDFWEKAPDRDPDVGVHLELKRGKSPAAAIQAIFDRTSKWAFDCAEFVQVVQLYALLKTLGPTQFDEYITKQARNGVVMLRTHWSTGLRRKTLYKRSAANEGMVRETNGSPEVGPQPSVEDLLAAAPIGARVLFTNPTLPRVHPFHNENTVLLGADRFGANAGKGNVREFTRKEIEQRMAQAAAADGGSASTDVIFISEIEIYDLDALLPDRAPTIAPPRLAPITPQPPAPPPPASVGQP